jgi:general secretion pathway protein D
VELEVEATIGPDGFTIDLQLQPKVTEFEGFINYGSPINTTANNFLVVPTPGGDLIQPFGTRQIVLTENFINQPVFSYRQVQTNVTIYDGMTVALGGLIREDIQNVQDKVPILGDIPLLGRAFRTDASQHIKRNLIIFVTANLIDPAGQPLVPEVEDDMVLPGASEALLLDEIIPGDASSTLPQL